MKHQHTPVMDAQPLISRHPSLTLRQVRPALWRVLRADGSLAGYIEGREAVRFEARRLVASTRQVVGLGDFSNMDDALSCF